MNDDPPGGHVHKCGLMTVNEASRGYPRKLHYCNFVSSVVNYQRICRPENAWHKTWRGLELE